jgi:acetoacetyl-CoA synthetase
VWSHGDWIEIRDDGGCVISGRSDATLNRGGVRIGTSEIYRTVEDVAGVSSTTSCGCGSSARCAPACRRAVATTLSRKKLELSVEKILLGHQPDDVASRDSLRGPRLPNEIASIARSR